jgi:DNA-binding CsgD family transcriptional regulator
MLLGRKEELEEIAALLDRARRGTSAVLALVGEAGIGKSSLLEWAAAQAHDMNVLRARGVQSEAHLPFAALFELLRPALVALEQLPAPQKAALESALALRPAQAHERFAVGAATLGLLAAYAELTPLAVLIDDAHWLDGSSADALRFALRRLVADPIAVALTAREAEPSLLDGADFRALRLGGLDADDAAELLRVHTPAISAEAAARLHRETGGNPLALLELAGELPSDVPLETPVPGMTTVSAAYLERVRALPERARHALVLASASDSGDLAAIARAAAELGLDLQDLLPAEADGLVELHADRIAFRHPLIRSAVYAAASPKVRRAAHRALADALPDAEADRRAWHLALATIGLDERASSALEQAGRRARDRSAYDVASQAFERAARLSPAIDHRGSLLYAAADAAWLAGLADRALALLDDTARAAAEETLRVDVEHLRGYIALRRGPLDEGRTVLEVAAERAEPAQGVAMLAEAAMGAFYAADAAGMRACGDRAAALAAGVAGDRAAFFGRITRGMGLVLSADGEGAAAIRQAVRLFEQSDALRNDTRLLEWAMLGPLWLREATEGRELVEQTIAAARERVAVGALPHLLSLVGLQQTQSGRWLEAQAGFDEAIRLARETGQRVVLGIALAWLAKLEARLGREDETRTHVDEALALSRKHGVTLCEIWSLAALLELELGLGNPEAALARADEQQALIDRSGLADIDQHPTGDRIELYLRLGRLDDATQATAAYSQAATEKGQPWSLARAARCRALLAVEAEFEARFEEALAFHARTPDVFEPARTQLAYGARLRRAGQRVRAREHLRAAFHTFDDLGAAPWAEIARLELAATGETARRRDPSTLDELTPQELNVSLLLAGGKTTRETAAALFLSPKTIEYHLRNAYRKLGARSRKELATALTQRRGVARSDVGYRNSPGNSDHISQSNRSPLTK